MATVGFTPRLGGLSVTDPASAPLRTPIGKDASKAWAQAKDFEAQFLSSMFQNMFTDIGNDGPMGNSQGVAPWRSFLTGQYGKAVAKSGGIGLADHVYRSLMAHQEARAS